MKDIKIDILNDREQRGEKIRNLSDAYGHTIVSGRINYPGVHKHADISIYCFDVLRNLMLFSFSDILVYKELWDGADGLCYLMVLKSDADSVKQKSMALESMHPLGRLFDIDVYNEGVPVSRDDINTAKRACLICNDLAVNCMILSRHTKEDLIKKIDEMVNSFRVTCIKDVVY